MTTLSTYLANKIAEFTFRGTAYTSPSTVYASLYNTEPGVDDSGIELSGAGYARQALSFGSPAARTISNDTAFAFGAATSTWLSAGWLGIHDALTGGNLLSYSAIVPVVAVPNTEYLTFPIGNLNVQLTGVFSEYWSHAMLSHIYLNSAATPPASLYLALYSDDPGADDSGTELSGNAYARQGITFGAAVNGLVETDATIDFPNSTPGGQGSNTHFGIRDASSGGNLISFGQWQIATSIVLDSHFQVPANNLAQKAA